MNKSFDYSQPLARFIRRILFREWDPVGVNLNDDMIDEYDSYLPEIYRLAMSYFPAEDIAAQLDFVETRYMLLRPNRAKNLAVAKKIAAVGAATRRP